MRWFLLIVAIVLTGCSEMTREGGNGGHVAPTPVAVLLSMGLAFSWIGGAAMVFGGFVRCVLAASVAGWLVPGVGYAAAMLGKIPGVAGIATLAAEFGAFLLATGLAFVWLSNNWEWALAACGLAGLAWAWHRRALLRRWYLAWTHHT